MIPIVVFEKGVELPDGNCYIIAQDGIYLKKNTGLISGVVKMSKVSFLKEIKTVAKIKIPPISQDLFIKIFLFFREVFNLYGSEAVILLYFDEIKQEYLISAPKQTVYSAGIKYKPILRVEGYKLVGSIHSHADFEAFHSSTDQADENFFDGLHITVGHVNKQIFSISAELVVNENRFHQRPEDWLLGISERKIKRLIRVERTMADRYFATTKKNKSISLASYIDVSDVNYSGFPFYLNRNQRYELALPEETTLNDFNFPSEWLESVNKLVRPRLHRDYHQNYWRKLAGTNDDKVTVTVERKNK